ncbi:MAG: peptidoglycan editing factor PgeF [Pseudomonadota bacterium]
MPDWLVADWDAPSGVGAGVSLRTGGRSRGPYASGNVGAHVGDEPHTVQANRAALTRQLDLAGSPLWLDQVHGTRVVDADAWDSSEPPRADAAVTRTGRCLAIQTADCLPVLLASRDGSVFGAAHAGWRGLAGGVIEATLLAMRVPPDSIVAWLGPAISAGHYEIDTPVRAAFSDADRRLPGAFSPTRPGHYRCDLAAIAGDRLARAGVTATRSSRHCTYADEARFFSFRRDGRTGRQVSLIFASRRG